MLQYQKEEEEKYRESRKAVNLWMNLLQQKEQLDSHADSLSKKMRFNFDVVAKKSFPICMCCEKPITSQHQIVTCASKDCKKQFHKECAFQFMSIKHLIRVNEKQYLFFCEHCCLGQKKCAFSGKIGDNLIKCRVKGCNRYYHPDYINQVRDHSRKEFVCGAHFCQITKKPFTVSDKVARCIRCYKACLAYDLHQSIDIGYGLD